MNDQPRHHNEAGPTKRTLMPLGFHAGLYTAYPQRAFQPKGLAVWGAPEGARVVRVVIGCEYQADVTCNMGIPARWFALGDNFEQLAKLLDAGKEPPNWVDWTPILPGQIARLELVDRHAQPVVGAEVVMWGLSPSF